MAVPVVVAVGEAVSGKQCLAAGIEAPQRRAQVADHRLDGDELAVAEVDLIADLHGEQSIGMPRKGEVVVGNVAMHRDVRPALEDAAEAAGMRRLLMRDEQIFERRAAFFRQDVPHLTLDFREVLRMAGLDQHRGLRSADQERGVVGMIGLALVILLKAIAEPEDIGRDFARKRVRFGQSRHDYLSRPRGMYCGLILERSSSRRTLSSTVNCRSTWSRPRRMVP